MAGSTRSAYVRCCATSLGCAAAISGKSMGRIAPIAACGMPLARQQQRLVSGVLDQGVAEGEGFFASDRRQPHRLHDVGGDQLLEAGIEDIVRLLARRCQADPG